MAVETLKTPSITALDTRPLIGITTGQGASGKLRSVNDHIAATAATSATSTYRMCRIPTNAVIKHVFLKSVAMGAGSVDIDVAMSDSTTDGTPSSLQGIIPQIAAADNKLFGAAIAMTSAIANVEQTFAGTFTTTHQNMPLWSVLVNLGTTTFTTDPGGFFDFVIKVAVALTNGGDISLEVQFVTD